MNENMNENMSEAVKELLINGEIAFKNGQYDVTLELCEQAIEKVPSNADAHTGAGKTCLVLGRLQDAEKYLEKAVGLDETNGEKYFDLGNIKFGLEKYSESLVNYAKAEQLGCADTTKQKLYYQIGMINYMMGDIKSALLNFDKCESFGAVNADSKEVLLKRLQIYIESQDFANAENYAIQLKMLAPAEFRSYQIYFQILAAMGKYDKAQEVLTEAESYADIASDISNKADVVFDKIMLCAVKADKDSENASQYYEEALSLLAEFEATSDLPIETLANIAFSKSEIYLKLERFDDALSCVGTIEENDQTKEKAAFIKLSCYFGKEEYEKAVEYAEQLKLSENEYYVYFATYADVFAARKLAGTSEVAANLAEFKYNNAVAFFKNITFKKPQDIFSIIFRVRLYAEYGKFVKAEELIKLMPDTLKNELNKYISDCRKELEKG